MSDDPADDDTLTADAGASAEAGISTDAGDDPAPTSRADEEPRADGTSDPEPPGSTAPPETAATIDPEPIARLAGLHLRMGLYTLARAELEALRVLGSIDDAGLEALAEACWRTGDLAAAGSVAVPMAQAGSSRPIVLAIAAEAIADQGRPAEAGRFVSLAMEGMDVPLDTLFAGLPRHASWPSAAPDVLDAGSAGSVPAAPGGAAPSAAAEAYAGGRAALAAGDAARAALEMGVALRLDPGFATEVLDVIGTRATEPGLVLVAGDALRILGREQEALAAFDIARGAAALVADAAAAEPDARDRRAPGEAGQTDVDAGGQIWDGAPATDGDRAEPPDPDAARIPDPSPEVDPRA